MEILSIQQKCYGPSLFYGPKCHNLIPMLFRSAISSIMCAAKQSAFLWTQMSNKKQLTYFLQCEKNQGEEFQIVFGVLLK